MPAFLDLFTMLGIYNAIQTQQAWVRETAGPPLVRLNAPHVGERIESMLEMKMHVCGALVACPVIWDILAREA
jgi:hypothetical protein